MIGGSDVTKSRTYQELVELNNPITNPYVSKLPQDYNLGFSPRGGFAYDVTGRGNHVVRGGFGLYYGNTFQNIPLFMEQMSNETVFQTVLSLSSPDQIVTGTGIPLGNWRYGIDPMPTIPPPSTELAEGSVGRLMDPNYRNPVTEEFNAGYTWGINTNTAVEVEYTHVLGLHENKTMNIDQKIPTGSEAGDCCTRPLDADFAAHPDVPQMVSVRNEESIGRSHYDGTNFTFKSRMNSHFTLNANYTLAWANGYSSGGGSFRNYPFLSTDPFAKWEWGPSPNDERHHITVSGVVNLPWKFDLAPILQYGSARPYGLTNSAANTLNTAVAARPPLPWWCPSPTPKRPISRTNP